VIPYQNSYKSQGTDIFAQCMFDPIDDGNDEDDFFDPGDPLRRLGPSSTCFPAFVFAWAGDTFSDFSEANLGEAEGGTTPGSPALRGFDSDGGGPIVPQGSWVEARVDLSQFRGQRIRVRYLVSAIKVGTFVTIEDLFSWNPIGADDGWWIDDVSISNTLTTAATLAADTANKVHTNECGDLCGVVTANLVVTPTSIGAPGQPIELDASTSTATYCVDGAL
jgi:hypothetical protein